MKSILILMLGVTLIMVSCKNDDDALLPFVGATGGAEHMSAKIDGADWAAQQNFGDLISATGSETTLAIQGGDNSGNTIRINLSNYAGAQTYVTGDNISNTNSISYVSISPIGSWMSTFDIESGTIDVTSDENNVIEGTFSFTGYNSTDMTNKVVTNGSFKVNKE